MLNPFSIKEESSDSSMNENTLPISEETVEEKPAESLKELAERTRSERSRRKKPKGRPRERKPLSSSAAAPVSETIPDMPAGIMGDLYTVFAGVVPFSLLAGLSGDNKWLITDDEKRKLAPLWEALAEKYMPMVSGQYGVEIVLAVSVGSILIGKSGIFDPKPEASLESEPAPDTSGEMKPREKSEKPEDLVSPVEVLRRAG